METTQQRNNHILLIEETKDSAVNMTLLNLEFEGGEGIAALRNLIKEDSSGVIVLMIPDGTAYPDAIVQGIKTKGSSYIKKPLSGKEMKKRLAAVLSGGEAK